jgi:peptidoglycan/xylan/chitin deacetylase (PgdA/CDA1 family)
MDSGLTSAVRGSTTIRSIARLPPVERIVRVLASVAPRRRDTLAVLTFHRVAPPAGAVPGLLSATPDGFARLLDLLAEQFRVVTIDAVIERQRGRAGLPPGSLLLTFDDGYRDLADHAWPALVERGLPATLFVPSGFPGRPDRSFWWERAWATIEQTRRPVVTVGDRVLPLRSASEKAAAYRAIRGLIKAGSQREIDGTVARLESELANPGASRPEPSGRSLDWQTLRDLRGAGLALGSHTRSHPLLDRVDDRTLAEEITGGVEDLARETGSDLPAFAYPSGAFDDRVVAAVRAAGIGVAFTTERGVNDLRAGDWLRLRRINVALTTPPSLILAQAVR